jgi:large subunit ribosomal protein L17
MNHRIAGRKFSMDTEQRTALFRNLAIALFTHGQITTSIPKAKSVQPFVEKLITAAKKGDLASRRQVIARLGDKIVVKNDTDDTVERNKYGELVDGPRVVKKLFAEIAPQYKDRSGGYTRIVKLARHRIGDGTSLCVLQLVGGESENGPQVRGQHSRRREKADRRTAFAAKIRKAKPEAAAPAAEAPKAE